MSRRRRRWRASEDPLVQWGCLVPATLLLVGWVMFTIGLITYLFGGDFWTVLPASVRRDSGPLLCVIQTLWVTTWRIRGGAVCSVRGGIRC